MVMLMSGILTGVSRGILEGLLEGTLFPSQGSKYTLFLTEQSGHSPEAFWGHSFFAFPLPKIHNSESDGLHVLEQEAVCGHICAQISQELILKYCTS
jgi:hypothetical protein